MSSTRRSINPVFSAEAMGKALGVSKDTVERWETGKKPPSAEQLAEYCGVLIRKGVTKFVASDVFSSAYPTMSFGHRADSAAIERRQTMKQYTDAIRREPSNPSNYGLRARLYEIQGERDKAYSDYCEAIRVAPNDPALYAERAKFNHRLVDPLADLGHAIRLDPHNSSYYDSRAEIHERMQNWELVVDDLTDVINLEIGSIGTFDLGMLYIRRSTAYEKLELLESAADDLRRAIKLEPDGDAFLEIALEQLISRINGGAASTAR